MGYCREAGGDCEAQPNFECLSCLLGLSEIEIKALSRFLEDNRGGLLAAGLSSNTVESIIDAVTI